MFITNGMYLSFHFFVLPRASYVHSWCGFIPSVVWNRMLALNKINHLYLDVVVCVFFLIGQAYRGLFGMYMCPCIYPSIHMSVHLSICLYSCLYVCWYISMAVCPLGHLEVYSYVGLAFRCMSIQLIVHTSCSCL